MWSLFGKLRISRDDLPMQNFFSGWDGFVPNKAMLEGLYLRRQEWGIPKLFARMPNPYFEQQEVLIDLSWDRTKESFTLLRAILQVLPELLPDIAARLEGERSEAHHPVTMCELAEDPEITIPGHDEDVPDSWSFGIEWNGCVGYYQEFSGKDFRWIWSGS